MKRLAGTAYGKIATRAEFRTTYRMLSHDYWIIWNAASEAIRKHGTADDLEHLLELAIAKSSDSDGVIEAICAIDDKSQKE